MRNFPGNYDIGVLSNIQGLTTKKFLNLVILVEKMLKIAEMSILIITVNSGFKHETTLKKLNFTKKIAEINPHSGNMVKFFIKEI